jgi:hypothetical protein
VRVGKKPRVVVYRGRAVRRRTLGSAFNRTPSPSMWPDEVLAAGLSKAEARLLYAELDKLARCGSPEQYAQAVKLMAELAWSRRWDETRA